MNRPEYGLSRVESSEADDPRVISVDCISRATGMSRRTALGAGISLLGTVSAIKAYASASKHDNKKKGGAPVICSPLATGLRAHKLAVRALAVTSDGQLLASASDDGTVKLWSLPERTLRSTLLGHKYAVVSLAISPDGSILASTGPDKTLKLWSLPKGELIATFAGYRAVAIAPDGKLVAASLEDNTIDLRALPDGRYLRKLPGHSHTIFAMTITPDSGTLASGDAEGNISLWSLPEGKSLISLRSKAAIRSLAISPDGKILAAGTEDANGSVWSLPDGRFIHITVPSVTECSICCPVEITADGKMLVVGRSCASIDFWRLAEWDVKNVFRFEDTVSALKAAPNGRHLICGSDRGGICIWDLPATTEASSCNRSYLFDPSATPSDHVGSIYDVRDEASGRTVSYTLPCDWPMPTGAVCTCNCVPGTLALQPTYTPTYTPSYEPPLNPSAPTTNTVPCGTPVPQGQVCTCNCMAPSSRRWKTNIKPLVKALDQVERLSAVRFDWNDNAPEGFVGPDFGFIAEEVASVVPEVVAIDSEGTAHGIDYARLTALLVEAIKDQQQQIQELGREVKHLKYSQRRSPSAAIDVYEHPPREWPASLQGS